MSDEENIENVEEINRHADEIAATEAAEQPKKKTAKKKATKKPSSDIAEKRIDSLIRGLKDIRSSGNALIKSRVDLVLERDEKLQDS